jgi:molybdopterin/thiamine biosynthesis adenylyltransferase
MDRFDRQRRIPGWDQDRLARARVLVCGRTWVGTFTVWGLASLGVGEILWLGAPQAPADALARWLLADPPPFAGCAIHDYPFDVEFGGELAWAAAGDAIDIVVAAVEEPRASQACAAFAHAARAAFLAGTAASGGWVGGAVPPVPPCGREHPATAMAAAACLIDGVRATLMSARPARRAEGALGLAPPHTFRDDRGLLVGVGGIGVYVATLAAALGFPTHLLDHDRIDVTNLNRQGLFRPNDAARGGWKAEVAFEVLSRLFPRARLGAHVARAGRGIDRDIDRFGASIVLSAVDNAETRLLLQAAARRRGLPIVQGGTDTFMATVVTQEREGATLDEQLRGAMSRGAAGAGAPRRGGCAADPSYVAPGMMAAGLMMARALQVSELYRGLPPIHWRAGAVPVEEKGLRDAFAIIG